MINKDFIIRKIFKSFFKGNGVVCLLADQIRSV
jgi:hypothetical protein